jgi:hypothetical protein
MMNRFLGVLFALATIAIVVFAILNTGNYRSMVFDTNEEMPAMIDDVIDEDIPDAMSTEDTTIVEPTTTEEEVMPLVEDIITEEPVETTLL